MDGIMSIIEAQINRSMASARRWAARIVLQLLDQHFDVKSAGGVGAAAGGQKESVRKAELWQHYGFSSRPPSGAELLAIMVGGEAGHTVCAADNHRPSRPEWLADGESILYNQGGLCVLCTNGQVVEIRTYAGTTNRPTALTSDDAIVRKSDLQAALDALKLQVNASLAGCQSGSGGPPIVGVIAQASDVGRCE